MKTLQLEAHDLGRPTCPNVYIKKEGEEYDGPCAIDNGHGEWLYNWEGAMKESEYLGKRMPTDEEFDLILKTKSDMPNIAYAGYCSSGSSCNYRGTNALYWSSTESSTSAWRRNLNYSDDSVTRYTRAQSYDFSVRCLKDTSDTSSIRPLKHTYTKTFTRDDGVIFTEDSIEGKKLEEYKNEITDAKSTIKKNQSILQSHTNLFSKK